MAMGLIEGFIGAIRAAFGLDPKPGVPPDILHLGLYPAKVDKCAADGSTCDVTPADTRISARQNVRVLRGVPGSSAAVDADAIVLLGFAGGDPSQPYVMPLWAVGANVEELIFAAVATYLGGKSGADGVLTKKDFQTFLKAWQDAAVGTTDGGALMRTNTIGALTTAGWSVGAALAALGSTKVQAQR
jgi:hypothetical protein